MKEINLLTVYSTDQINDMSSYVSKQLYKRKLKFPANSVQCRADGERAPAFVSDELEGIFLSIQGPIRGGGAPCVILTELSTGTDIVVLVNYIKLVEIHIDEISMMIKKLEEARGAVDAEINKYKDLGDLMQHIGVSLISNEVILSKRIAAFVKESVEGEISVEKIEEGVKTLVKGIDI